MTMDKELGGLEQLKFVEEGVEYLKPCFSVSVYWRGGLLEHAEGIRHFYERSLELLRPRLLHYQTDTMKRPKKLKAEAFEFVPFWLSENNPNPKAMRMLFLESSAKPDGASEHAFMLFAMPVLKAGGVRLVLPVDFVRSELGRLPWLIEEMVSGLRFCSGSAGYGLKFNETSQLSFLAKRDLYPLIKRYHGLDLDYSSSMLRALEHKPGLGCVNWLTLLGKELIQELGGQASLRARLPGEVQLRPLPHGVMLQAGAQPELGDVNRRQTLPLYHAVGSTLAPVRFKQMMPFIRSPPGYTVSSEETMAWLERFDK